jgi:subtilisin family serine protease
MDINPQEGTSFSTPHVVGVSTLLWSAMPNATNSQIAWAMQATAKDLGEKGWDEHHRQARTGLCV